MKDIIIAIDGFSSCGKSTLAKELAKNLNYTYLDTGAMYRAVTLFCLRNKIINNGDINIIKLKSLLDSININFKLNIDKSEIYLNGENIENQIRSLEVSNSVSLISSIKEVREQLVKHQQIISKNKRIVIDGRDIGTVVFPNAELKLFMTADVNVRAKRRHQEYIDKGDTVSLSDIIKNISERDYLDQNRKESPLKQAKDAIVLDNSNINQKEQLQFVMNLIIEKFGEIPKNK